MITINKDIKKVHKEGGALCCTGASPALALTVLVPTAPAKFVSTPQELVSAGGALQELVFWLHRNRKLLRSQVGSKERITFWGYSFTLSMVVFLY